MSFRIILEHKGTLGYEGDNDFAFKIFKKVIECFSAWSEKFDDYKVSEDEKNKLLVFLSTGKADINHRLVSSWGLFLKQFKEYFPDGPLSLSDWERKLLFR